MRAQLILVLSVVLAALLSPAMAGTGTITISGNSTTNATSTVTGVNTVVTITAWNTGNGIKTFKVNVTNASDDLTFYLYNFTGLKVNEFKLNSTPQNGYQANSTGVITFTIRQTTGNATYNLQPAVNQGGFNYTWGWFNNVSINNFKYSYQQIIDSINGMTIQNTKDTDQRTIIGIAPYASTDLNADLLIYRGFPGWDLTTNIEATTIGYDNTGNYFFHDTESRGTGAQRPLILDATGRATNFYSQLKLLPNGSVYVNDTFTFNKGTGGTGDATQNNLPGLHFAYNATLNRGYISAIDKGVVWKNITIAAAQTNITSTSLVMEAVGAGITMRSPDGTYYCFTIANGGTTAVAAGQC